MSFRFAVAAGAFVALAAVSAGCGPKISAISDEILVAEGAPPGPNSGIIKTGFGAVVVDGQPGFKAAEGLRKAAEKRTGYRVMYLIMTSHHADHSLGNEVFRRAEIISTAAARKAFGEKVEAERKLLVERLKIPGIKSAVLMPATMAFEKSLTLYAGWPKDKATEIRLLEMPSGAAPGNLVVYLPKEKILFAGDLATNGVFPYMGDADVGAWVKALDALEELDVEHLVPGHGKSGGKEILWHTRKFLADLCAAIRKARAGGKSAEQIKKTLTLPGYDKWPAYKELLPVAVDRLWDQKLPDIKLPPKPKAKPKPAPKKKSSGKKVKKANK